MKITSSPFVYRGVAVFMPEKVGNLQWHKCVQAFTISTLAPLTDQHITQGTYENLAFTCNVVRDGATEALTLTIPHLVVE